MNRRKFIYSTTIALGLATLAMLTYPRGLPPPNGSTLPELNDAEKGGLCLAASALGLLASFAENQTCAKAKGNYPIVISVGPTGNGSAAIGIDTTNDDVTLMNQLVDKPPQGAKCNVSTEGGGILGGLQVNYSGNHAWNSGNTSFREQADTIEIADDALGLTGVVPTQPVPLPPTSTICNTPPLPTPPPSCIMRIMDGCEVITRDDFPLSNWSEQWKYRLLTATDSKLRMTKKRTLPDTKCKIALKVKGVITSNGLGFKGTATVTSKKH